MKACINMYICVLLLLSTTFIVTVQGDTGGKSVTYVTGRIKDLQINNKLIQFTSIKLYSKVLFQYIDHRWYFGGSYGWDGGITHEYPRDEYRFCGILKEPFIRGILIFKAS